MNRTTKRGILALTAMLALMLALTPIGAFAKELRATLDAQAMATVSFDPGTGTGHMDAVEVNVGSEYELPDCTFTHTNEERTFYRWSVGNELKESGDSITVEGDTTVTALWQYTKYVKLDTSVDKSTTEVVGELTITDARTGDATTLIVYDEVTASSFTEPTNPTVNAMVEEAKAALADEANRQAGGNPVTVISETVSDPEITKTQDDRTYMHVDTPAEDENGDYYAYLIIDGAWLHRWCKTVTLKAEYTSDKAGDAWRRLAGAKGTGRLGTMAAIVQTGFDQSDYAVLSTGWKFPDALVASSVAGKLGCPVILTDPAKLSSEAATELNRLGVKHVYIMGSDSTVTGTVASQLLSQTGVTKVDRIEGTDRQATSLEAMKWLDECGEYDGTVVVTTGVEFADALAIGPWCYRDTVPILLADKNGKLSDDQFAALEQGTGLKSGTQVKKVIVLGGTNRVSQATRAVLASLVGDQNVIELGVDSGSRYQTAAEIAEWEVLAQGMSVANVTVTKGSNYPDALAGAALDGKLGSVMVLVNEKSSVTQGDNLQALSFVKEHKAGIECGYVLGDENSVPKTLWDALNKITG